MDSECRPDLVMTGPGHHSTAQVMDREPPLTRKTSGLDENRCTVVLSLVHIIDFVILRISLQSITRVSLGEAHGGLWARGTNSDARTL